MTIGLCRFHTFKLIKSNYPFRSTAFCPPPKKQHLTSDPNTQTFLIAFTGSSRMALTIGKMAARKVTTNTIIPTLIN